MINILKMKYNYNFKNENAARPEGTSSWTEEQLVRLVSRDSMIGLCPASDPQLLSPSLSESQA